MIIAIDAGHGMKTAGKRCLKSIDPNETREWYLNDRIADRLEVLLKSYDCSIIRVDDTTGNNDVPLSTRVKKANDGNADIYISIHHNAGVLGGSGGGLVVFYSSSSEARKISATKLYNSIVSQTGLVGNRYDKVINNPFYVLKNTKMPAFLIENGFMDSRVDTPIILTQDCANKCAQGILNFLIDECKLKKKSDITAAPTPSVPVSNKIYRVQCGAYKNKQNALDLQKELRSKGYPAIIVEQQI